MTSPVLPFKDFKGTSLRWDQPKIMVRHHELKSGEDVYAALKWMKTFGSLAEATTADGRYTLKRGGFVRPFVTVRDVAYDNEIAVLRIGLLGHGTIEFSNGRTITVLSTSFWSYAWDLVSEGGQLLCRIKKRVKIGTNSADVTISKEVRKDRDLLVMIIACWYAMVLMSDEAAALNASVASNPALMGAVAV